MTLKQLIKEMNDARNEKKSKLLARYFKTGKGQYGEGDIFLGITVPEQRKLSKKHKELTLNEIGKLLKSKIHEHRLTALLILVDRYKKSDEKGKKEIFNFYLKNTKTINNWDLVDLSSPNIVGNYLLDKDRKTLYKLTKSKNIWEKRIAILATFTFIKNNEFKDALNISEILLKDKHDLMHKAVGWMLREIGKKNQKEEEKFLDKHCKTMPRTMLRYAIEKFNNNKKEHYMKR